MITAISEFAFLQYTVAQIKAEMQKILCWITPLAENTTRLVSKMPSLTIYIY